MSVELFRVKALGWSGNRPSLRVRGRRGINYNSIRNKCNLYLELITIVNNNSYKQRNYSIFGLKGRAGLDASRPRGPADIQRHT